MAAYGANSSHTLLGIGVQTQERNQVVWIGISGTTAWWYPQHELVLIAIPQMLFKGDISNHFLQMAQELPTLTVS